MITINHNICVIYIYICISIFVCVRMCISIYVYIHIGGIYGIKRLNNKQHVDVNGNCILLI